MAAHPPKKDRTNERAKTRLEYKSLCPGIHRQPKRIDDTNFTRVDGRACFNCGAAYARCNCHRPVEVLRGVAL